MSRIMKRLTSLLIVVLMLLLMVLPTAAIEPDRHFLALGDSIGYGLSAVDPVLNPVTKYGFNDLFAAKLGSRYAYVNDCWPGNASSDLVQYVFDPLNATKISQTNVMTISSGSNNLLGPVIAAILGLYGIDPTAAKYENDLNGAIMLNDLLIAVTSNESPSAAERLSWLMTPLNPHAIKFNLSLLAGVAAFTRDWPKAIARIRQLAPTAEVYVNTVYNPMRVSGTADPLYPLYTRMESMIKSINLIIKGLALTYHYRVVDVYSVFRAFRPITYKFDQDVLTFNILAAVQAQTFDDFFHAADPHPAPLGHVKICGKLIAVRSTTPSWYWRLSSP